MIDDRDASALNLLFLCNLFSDLDTARLDPAELPALAPELSLVSLKRGEALIKQGADADCMYAVITGRLQVLVDGDDGEETLIGELRAGETVGELGLIDGSRRMASVVAVRDSQLVRISAAGFDRLVRLNPDSVMRIARAEAERMRTMGRRRTIEGAVRTITVVGTGEGAGFDSFTSALCGALSELGSVLQLSRSQFESLFHRPFNEGDGAAAWMSELESAHHFVVCEADPDASPWTMQCLRQADRILLVRDSSSSPELTPAERMIFDEREATRVPPVELVLLQEHNRPVFAGTSRWLQPRPVARHHHVRRGVPGDAGRVARLLTGRAVGVALGGGGARGFSHIGTLRALEEGGVPIDMICGVSMGAIIGALYAMGCSWQEMVRLTKREWTRKMTFDLALPVVAFSTGRKFRRALDTLYGDAAIEDLGLAYFCTSCDLSTSELMIHRTGSLANAVHASNAIPVVLPPVLSGGHVLVDGGVLNNQPGDVLKTLCGGSVVVANVSPRTDTTVDASFTEMPSAWQVLRSRFSPFEAAIRVPGIMATMMRTMMVASQRKSLEVERMADYYLRPPVDRFRVDAFDRIEELADVGYTYAREEIRRWNESGRLFKTS